MGEQLVNGTVVAGCGKLYRARSRLYRRQILQANMRWKALAEIYTMHSFEPLSKLNFFVKIAVIGNLVTKLSEHLAATYVGITL